MSEGQGRWIDYAGGYSDMVAQRGGGVDPREAPKEVRAPSQRPVEAAPAPAPRSSRRKLTFKEKHALDTLPSRIDALVDEASALAAALADSGLFSRDPGRFAFASQRLAAIEMEKSALEERWLELEMLREEMETGA